VWDRGDTYDIDESLCIARRESAITIGVSLTGESGGTRKDRKNDYDS